MEEEEKPDWSTVNAGLNRLKVVYYARQQKKLRDASANILFLDQLPKFEMVATTPGAPGASLGTNPLLRLSISNLDGDRPLADLPCSLNHEHYMDFHTIALQQDLAAEGSKNPLHGAWRGTCKLASSSAKCTVDVSFWGSRSLRIMYSGCDILFLGMPQVQTAVYAFQDDSPREARTFDDLNLPTPQWLYQRLDLTHTSHLPGVEGREAHASIAWPVHVNYEDMDQMLFHILRVGMFIYIHACMHACMHTRTHACIHTYAHKHAHYICTHTHV